MSFLEIIDLYVTIDGKEILKGFNLNINPGEVHALMGPNGSGKSTLSYVITGRPGYEVTKGRILFKGQDLLALPIEERAREGVFLALQYPVEIPGVATAVFLKHALNAVRKHRGDQELDTMSFIKLMKEKANLFGINQDLTKRFLNVGFSGGEKKRVEALQMAILEPSLAILDETDSGLDIDALKVVSTGINHLRSNQRSMLVITHYQRLLNYIVPDFVHVLAGGRIVKSGGKNLALELEEYGYGEFV